MVWPMIAAAAIGAGGSIAGGLLGASAQDEANAQNYAIALMNYYQQENARREALTEAQRQEGETKLGTTDAEGNRTYFKPGVGWVTEQTEETEQLSDLYRNEELLQLTQDLPAKRAQMRKNLSRQGKEENVAGGLLEAMMRNYRRDPQDIVGRRNRMTAEAANEGYDAGMTSALKDAMRTGSGGQAKIASQVGRDKYDALRKAFMENSEGAADVEENRFMTEQGNLANLYNTFATRASAMPDAQYNPRNLEGASAQQLQQAMSSGRTASGSLLNAFGASPAQLNYKQEPNFGLANTIAQAGQSVAGSLNLYDSMQGQGPQNYSNYARTNYFPPQPSAPSGGVAANMYTKGTGPWGA